MVRNCFHVGPVLRVRCSPAPRSPARDLPPAFTGRGDLDALSRGHPRSDSLCPANNRCPATPEYARKDTIGSFPHLILQRHLSEADGLTCGNAARRETAVTGLKALSCDFGTRPAHASLQY